MHSFPDRKARGAKAEIELMEQLALMGATVHVLGHLPDQPNNAPRHIHPHPTAEEGFKYSVCPDLHCHLPWMGRGEGVLIQAKMKTLRTDGGTSAPYVYLDEKELHRMNRAAVTSRVLFVIQVHDSEWYWLDIDSLRKGQTELHKRRVSGVKTFVLPFDLFQPLSTLKTGMPIETANTNTSPTAERA